jgi:hypothetical protein
MSIFNQNLYKENPHIIASNKVIVSLTTIPPRFITKEFDLVIESLVKQILKPIVIINICKNYKRKFKYDENMYNEKIKNYQKENVYINVCDNDLGPIMKILGLYNFNAFKISKNDIVIVIDDDFELKNSMTYYYTLCYEIYNCECIFTDHSICTSKTETIFQDFYNRGCYGYSTFSFKYRHVKKIYDFYIDNIKLDDNLWKHDDLILTLYYKYKNLYACGINLNFHILPIVMNKNVKNNALHLENQATKMRIDLERKFNSMYKFNNMVNFTISKRIDERKLLYNIKNLESNSNIKYFNNNILIITTCSNKTTYKINNKIYNVDHKNSDKKRTFFIKCDQNLEYIPHQPSLIVQNITNLNHAKFYNIVKILNENPEMKYHCFMDKKLATDYLKENGGGIYITDLDQEGNLSSKKIHFGRKI